MLGRVTVGLLFALLVWGNLVAGLKAGLACPDWPLCHGKVLPPLRWDIYMEFIHRVLGAAAGAALLVLSWRRLRSYRGAARAVPAAAALLLAAEIGLGALVVLLQVPPRLTTVHFAVGVAVFAAACYMEHFDGTSRAPVFPAKGYGGLFLGMAALVFAVAALGAYVRHSGAGLSLPNWPASNRGLFPESFSQPVLFHFTHRVAAALIFLTAAALYAASAVDDRLAVHRRLARGLFLMCLAQVAAGGAVVLTGLWFLAAGLHLGLALGMLTVTLEMWFREAGGREGVSWAKAR